MGKEPTDTLEPPATGGLSATTGPPPQDNPYQPPGALTVRPGGTSGMGGPGVGGHGFRPIRWAGTAAMVGLSCTAGLAAFSIVVLLIWSWSSLFGGGEAARIPAWTASQLQTAQVIYWSELFVGMLTAIVFLIWFHRCYRNLASLHVEGTKYSTRWAVGGWFIPIWNFFRPYQVAREIWNASNPDVHDAEGPRDWLQKRSAHLVLIWWLLHWTPVIMHYVSDFFLRQSSLDLWRIGSWLLVAENLGIIGSAVVEMLLIWRTNARQAERHSRLQTILASHPLAHLGPEQRGGSAHEQATFDAGVEQVDHERS